MVKRGLASWLDENQKGSKMPVSRRGVVGGLLALPVGVRALSAAPMTMPAPAIVPAKVIRPAVTPFPQMFQKGVQLHPLFGVQTAHHDVALFYTLNVERCDSMNDPDPFYASLLDRHGYPRVPPKGNRISIRVRSHAVGAGDAPGVTNGVDVFRNLSDAEDALIGRLVAPHRDVCQRGLTMTGPNIIRAANRIGVCTRRGAGNTMLMNRDDLTHVVELSLFKPNFIPRRIGRWDNVGTLVGMSGIQVWVTDDPCPSIKPGYALVGYRGSELDAGAYLMVFPGNRIGLFQPERAEGFDGYFHTVGLTREARLPYLKPDPMDRLVA
jgi:hypothetical protein